MTRKMQVLREIREVTEWKGDCVYRTESRGYVWLTHGTFTDYAVKDNKMYCAVSVHKSATQQTIRMVSLDTPDVVEEKDIV